MRFELHIGLGHDAMKDEIDVAEMLRTIAAEIEVHHFPGPDRPQRIRDAIGHRRGYWVISESEVTE